VRFTVALRLAAIGAACSAACMPVGASDPLDGGVSGSVDGGARSDVDADAGTDPERLCARLQAGEFGDGSPPCGRVVWNGDPLVKAMVLFYAYDEQERVVEERSTVVGDGSERVVRVAYADGGRFTEEYADVRDGGEVLTRTASGRLDELERLTAYEGRAVDGGLLHAITCVYDDDGGTGVCFADADGDGAFETRTTQRFDASGRVVVHESFAADGADAGPWQVTRYSYVEHACGIVEGKSTNERSDVVQPPTRAELAIRGKADLYNATAWADSGVPFSFHRALFDCTTSPDEPGTLPTYDDEGASP
jgi:hypothetical protein